MALSEVLASVSNSPKTTRFLSQLIAAAWTPGGSNSQAIVDKEVPSSMVREAELFLDRSVALFLLRQPLRKLQALTWSDVGVYYSNFFSACAISRLSLFSVTFVRGDLYTITPTAPTYFEFRITRKGAGASHKVTWDLYYKAVQASGWPDNETVSILAPVVEADRHRERLIRDVINYSPGRGFLEIHESPRRYGDRWQHLQRFDLNKRSADDSSYLETQAFHRLRHGLRLMGEIQRSYLNRIERDRRREARRKLIRRYASDAYEARLLLDCVPE